MKTNIIIGSGLIILYIAKSQRHRDTEILSIGVIILLYIESDVQKLLTYMKVNQVTNVCEFASQGKYGESISDIVGRILDEVDECRKKSKK